MEASFINSSTAVVTCTWCVQREAQTVCDADAAAWMEAINIYQVPGTRYQVPGMKYRTLSCSCDLNLVCTAGMYRSSPPPLLLRTQMQMQMQMQKKKWQLVLTTRNVSREIEHSKSTFMLILQARTQQNTLTPTNGLIRTCS